MNVFDLFAKIELDNKGYVRTLDATERATDTASRNMDNAFTRRIDNMRRRLNDFGSSASRIGGKLSRNLTAPIAAAGGAALVAADRFANVADAVDKSAQAAGLSAEDYQTLRFAFDQSGISAEGFDQALFSLNRRLGLAAQGNKTYQQAFEDLGVATRNANGDVRDSREVFDDLIAALGNVPSSAEAAALASVVFGDDVGKRLLPVINAGTDGLGDLEQQARDLGIVMTGEAINDLVTYKDEMNALRQSFQTAGVEITRELLPLLREFADFLQTTVVPRVESVTGFIGDLVEKWQELPEPIRNFGTIITTTLAATGPALTAIGGLSRVLGGVIALLTGPVGWVAAAGVVATALGVTLYNALNKHQRDLETYKGKVEEVAGVLGGVDDKDSLRGKLNELAEFLPDEERNGWKAWAQDAIDAAEDAAEAQQQVRDSLLETIALQDVAELRRREEALADVEQTIGRFTPQQVRLAEAYNALLVETGRLEVALRDEPFDSRRSSQLESALIVAETELSNVMAQMGMTGVGGSDPTRDILSNLAPALINRDRYLADIEQIETRLEELRETALAATNATATVTNDDGIAGSRGEPTTVPRDDARVVEPSARAAPRVQAEVVQGDRRFVSAQQAEFQYTALTEEQALERMQARRAEASDAREQTEFLNEIRGADADREAALTQRRRDLIADREREAGNAATRAATAAITSAENREDVLENQYEAYLERRQQTNAENARIELEQQTRFNAELRRLEEQNVADRERSAAAAAKRESEAANTALALRASQIASANQRERVLTNQAEDAAEERNRVRQAELDAQLKATDEATASVVAAQQAFEQASTNELLAGESARQAARNQAAQQRMNARRRTELELDAIAASGVSREAYLTQRTIDLAEEREMEAYRAELDDRLAVERELDNVASAAERREAELTRRTREEAEARAQARENEKNLFVKTFESVGMTSNDVASLIVGAFDLMSNGFVEMVENSTLSVQNVIALFGEMALGVVQSVIQAMIAMEAQAAAAALLEGSMLNFGKLALLAGASAGIALLISQLQKGRRAQPDETGGASAGGSSLQPITARDVGASFGRAPQGVQLAVAVPLMDAANMFGSHVDSFGSYVGRLVTEGISVNVGATSRTAALR